MSIFREKQQFGKKNKFTKVFLVFQFILSIITIVFGITFVQNADYQQQRDWGYNQSQTLVVPLDDEKIYTALKNEFLQNPNVVSVAGSRNHIGRSSTTSVIGLDGKKHEVDEIEVGYKLPGGLGSQTQRGQYWLHLEGKYQLSLRESPGLKAALLA